MTLEELQVEALKLGVTLGAAELELFALYGEALREANRRFNLTRIEEEGEIVRKHFLDSLAPAQRLSNASTLIDIGTGAGFPGLVLAIAMPDLQVTLVDSSEKKVGFLREVIQQLGLGNRAVAMARRAEDAGRDLAYRQRFDISISRAVAQLNVLAEYCLPLTRVGGEFLAMKGPAVREELGQAREAIRVLGGEIGDLLDWDLPGGGESRVLVVVHKARPTPQKYPRRAGLVSKNPL